MKILFVGDDWVGSNARSLADGFRQAGHVVDVVDSSRVTLPTRLSPPWLYAKVSGRRASWTTAAVQDEIETAAAVIKPDILFCYKTIHLDQGRLLNVPAGLHVHYSADDVSNPYNTTPEYLASESRWDSIVTTKRHNVPEIIERGGKHVTFVLSAYDPAWHLPCAARTTRRFQVGFIGSRRPDRVDLLHRLAKQFRGNMYLAGPGWQRDPLVLKSSATVAGPQYGQDFSVAIAPVTANLILLNSDNRDTHTCRTFEVPAAGGLFVGERTPEHLELLDDGTEALLFSDEAELESQLHRCTRSPAEVTAIAEAGYRRIAGGGHRYVDRAREILADVC
ncbi:UNVERIFIED_CONTAM: glycosyl transferase family 1 [Williamsia faeni]